MERMIQCGDLTILNGTLLNSPIINPYSLDFTENLSHGCSIAWFFSPFFTCMCMLCSMYVYTFFLFLLSFCSPLHS